MRLLALAFVLLTAPQFAHEEQKIEENAIAMMVAYKCNNPECRAIWDPTRSGSSCPTCGSSGSPIH